MRLRLVHQLALLLVVAVLLAVSLLGGVVAWNLKEGFGDYLRAQDEAWLDRFVALAQREVAERGMAALSGPRETLGPLLNAVSPEAAGAAPPPDAERPPPPWSPEGRRPRPPMPDPAGPRDPHGFGRRLVVLGADGQILWGRPPPQPGVSSIERALVVRGETVGQLRLYARPPAREGVDATFLLRQYRGIAWTAAGLVVLAVLCAVAVGRHWLAPVLQAQEAARRIAQGAFDVRLQRRGPGEFGALIDDINEMAASLQRLEGSRRRWIAELSHELRTPLAVLRAEIEGLVDGVRPLEHAALRSLQGEVERLTRLTDDFHQLALSDLRALPCHFEPVDLAALLQEVVDRHAERARAAGLSLRLAEMPIGVTLRADAQRLQQLFDNLLENSLRYTDAPGRIDISARRERDRVRVSVEDSAPGVPPEALQRLFEPLYRVEASRNRRSGGSGLGLAICRAIVQSHGGRISALASPLGGVRIDCELPL